MICAKCATSPRLPHDCHTTATAKQLPTASDCQRLPTIATAYLHIKRHIPHPRDQACYMTCNTQAPFPWVFHFLVFLQWQSCGNRWQSLAVGSCFAVAIVWQSCGSRGGRGDVVYFASNTLRVIRISHQILLESFGHHACLDGLVEIQDLRKLEGWRRLTRQFLICSGCGSQVGSPPALFRKFFWKSGVTGARWILCYLTGA